jgi:hypothetical protein
MASEQKGADNNDIGMPRWVKIFGVIALIAGLLFVIMFVARGPHRPGQHGPARHMSASPGVDFRFG